METTTTPETPAAPSPVRFIVRPVSIPGAMGFLDETAYTAYSAETGSPVLPDFSETPFAVVDRLLERENVRPDHIGFDVPGLDLPESPTWKQVLTTRHRFLSDFTRRMEEQENERQRQEQARRDLRQFVRTLIHMGVPVEESAVVLTPNRTSEPDSIPRLTFLLDEIAFRFEPTFIPDPSIAIYLPCAECGRITFGDPFEGRIRDADSLGAFLLTAPRHRDVAACAFCELPVGDLARLTPAEQEADHRQRLAAEESEADKCAGCGGPKRGSLSGFCGNCDEQTADAAMEAADA